MKLYIYNTHGDGWMCGYTKVAILELSVFYTKSFLKGMNANRIK